MYMVVDNKYVCCIQNVKRKGKKSCAKASDDDPEMRWDGGVCFIHSSFTHIIPIS